MKRVTYSSYIHSIAWLEGEVKPTSYFVIMM